jgi:ubiquitin-activating enzyme E1
LSIWKVFQTFFNSIDRENDIRLIIADTPGLFAQVFNDFGAKFVVSDVNGEEPISAMIANITQESEGGLVATLDEVRHGFEDGDHITFSEVEGMAELNGTTHKIKVQKPRQGTGSFLNGFLCVWEK